MEDVNIKFMQWAEDNAWELDHREQKAHTNKELFQYFIESIYKPI